MFNGAPGEGGPLCGYGGYEVCCVRPPNHYDMHRDDDGRWFLRPGEVVDEATGKIVKVAKPETR